MSPEEISLIILLAILLKFLKGHVSLMFALQICFRNLFHGTTLIYHPFKETKSQTTKKSGYCKGRVKIYLVPWPGPATGGRRFFFSEKIRGTETFFSKKKLGGRRLFFQKIRGAKTFFTKIFENPRFHFSKKAIFEDQKVIYVGYSDPSVIGA